MLQRTTQQSAGKNCISDMGLSVAEYFAQKEACNHCKEHGTEEHCVTTLLSRKENCLIYSIIHNQIGEYSKRQIELLHDLRSTSSEEENVIYYIRGERLIEKIGILNKPFYEQVSFFSAINYKYVKKIVDALLNGKMEDAKQQINTMLNILERENNIPKELNGYDYH